MSEEKKSEAAKREEATLAFWRERKIFEQSVEKGAPKGEYVFYEGPPTANGKPGIHHLESRVFKDAIPRYRTMCGYHVRRKAGWDTHGLPVELAVEKELGIKTKKDIEEYGIAKFNEKCKESVLRYVDVWKGFTDRIGYWVDHDDTYFTYTNDYIESVWHILKTASEKNMLYKDYKVVPWCPRCGTGLSSHEVAQGYKDIKDLAATVKFKVKNPEKHHLPENTYLLAWTTTPWTLPGNVALAVGKDISYILTEQSGDHFVRAKRDGEDSESDSLISGQELAGIEYEPLFDYYAKDEKLKNRENGWKVYAADFVTTDTGTGIVHIAPAFGEDDMSLGKRENLPFIQHVNIDGTFKPEIKDFAGLQVKPREDAQATDIEIIKYLAHHELLFAKEKIEHSYPHCWRCNTPLLYYARDSWYIGMSAVKETLIRENESIRWQPEHIRDGRFGEWLKDLKDWAISRSRYWGTPLPIWECAVCKKFEVIGSVKELEEKGAIVPEDLHRPYIDECVFPCECGGAMARVPDVLDVWFDSGAMPFAQDHYPFENKAWIDGSGYPADYISEAIDQTRGWFYTLHAIGAGIMGRGKAFKNVICLGHVLDANGKKMSKSVGNVVEPFSMIDKYGVDALRYFMCTVNAPGDSKNFDERAVDEIVKKHIGRLHNVLAFYQLYADGTVRDHTSVNILDRWILSRVAQLIKETTAGFEGYQLDAATRPIAGFIDDLSVWYVRRSRDRFKATADTTSSASLRGHAVSSTVPSSTPPETASPRLASEAVSAVADKQAALATLRYVLHTLARVIAPAMPFYAEHLFQAVREEEDEESVHLATWPSAPKYTFEPIDVLAAMLFARSFVTIALMRRSEAGIKVRQPLAKLTIRNPGPEVPFWNEIAPIIADEVNVKEVALDNSANQDVPGIVLDTEITPALEEEGFVRDTIREIQAFRKAENMRPGDPGTYRMTVSRDERKIIEKHLEHIKQMTTTTIEFAEND